MRDCVKILKGGLLYEMFFRDHGPILYSLFVTFNVSSNLYERQ